MSPAPAAAAAFRALLDDLSAVVEGYVEGDDTFTPQDVADGYRYVLALLTAAVEHRLEDDPERPWFSPIVSPVHKMLGDNGDARYHWCRIRGDRSYRITGNVGDAVYTSFTVHGSDGRGGVSQEILADVNDSDLDIAANGDFDVVISPTEHSGNWIATREGAESVIVRSYFSRERCAAGDPTVAVRLAIEPLDDPGPAPLLDDDAVAERLGDVARFVRAETIDRPSPDEMGPIPFVSREPNLLPAPVSFRDSGMATAGAVDIHYSMGPFVLGPDEALVMEGVLPSGPFANVMLWNRHMQTLDYRFRTTSLNDRQLVLGAGRSYRVVVAGKDPGVPNWLDTEGRPVGLVFWRFLLPDARPPRPECRVVPVAEVQP